VLGADAEQRARYRLESIESYALLNQSGCYEIDGVSDAEDLHVTLGAMRQLGFTEAELDSVLRALSAVLQLGNIQFRPEGSTGAAVSNPGALQGAAALLMVPAAALEKAVLNRTLKIKGQADMPVPLRPEQARESCLSLAKTIYGKMFDWLVARINVSMAAELKNSATRIGVLDIFGFEIFQTNSFEQLCINFCNEKLQQHFNAHTFKLEEELYKSEGVRFDHVEFIDNQPVLDLIEQRPHGILCALDEELRMPQSSDDTFLTKLHAAHQGKHPNYEKPVKLKDAFLVRHYAGDVAYTVTGFLDKNRDTLNEDLLKCMQASTCPLLGPLFPAEGADDASQRKATLGSQFRGQLTALMATLGATEPHYIRCIKPNPNKEARSFSAPMILQQLRYAGVFEAVRIRQSGFPFRYKHELFVRRYRLLDPRGATQGGARALVEAARAKGADVAEVQLGKTRVLYRAGPHRSLELLRSIEQTKAIVKMQKVSRGFLARRLYRAMRRLRPILERAIASRDLPTVEAALEEADGVRFEMLVTARCRRLRFVLTEERRIRAALGTGVLKRDPEQVYDQLSQLVREADEVGGMPGDQLVDEARRVVARVAERRQCIADLVAGAEEWDQGKLEAALARVDELGLAAAPETLAARETVAVLESETGYMVTLVEALGWGGSVEGDHSGMDTATLRSVLEAAPADPMRSPQGKQLVAIGRRTVELREAMMAADWEAVERALLAASAEGLETAEFEQARKEAAEQVGREKVLADLATAVAAMDHVQLEYALEQAAARGLLEEDAVKHAQEVSQWIANTREWMQAAVLNVSEEQLVYAVQLAESGGYVGNQDFLACRALRDKVVTLNREAKEALEVMDIPAMRAALDGLKAIKCETDDKKKLDELLNHTPADKLLNLQLKAATRLGDSVRVTNLTIEVKSLFFANHPGLFTLEKFAGFKTPGEFSKSYFFGKDKAKAGFFFWTKEPIPTALTHLEGHDSKAATRIFKSLMGAMGDKVSSYPEALLSDICDEALTSSPAVRDEVYAQVIKQLTRNPSRESVNKGYNALRVFLRTFPPGDGFANYLEIWLRDLIADNKDLKPYLRLLHKTLYGGAAKKAPSPQEIASILAEPEKEELAYVAPGPAVKKASADPFGFPAPPTGIAASTGNPPPAPPQRH
jgi:hypothetical protein